MGVASVADLFITLRAETAPFVSGMGKAAEQGESFTAKMGGLGGLMTKIGKATTVAGLGIAVVSVKMAGDFQASMQKLVTTAGESQSALKSVSNGVLDLAVQTGTSTKDLADGMYMVESAGFHGAQGLTVLKAAAQGARAEQAPLAEVTNAVTSALKSYHLGADQSVTVTNQMIAAVGHGKMTFSDLASSISTVLPIASSAKISFAQVGGAIATLTNHGTSAQEATQELANSIRNLQAPNNVAVQEMQRLGLSSVDVSTQLGTRGLTGTIQLLQQAVLSHMGPAGTVMISTLNQSKQASANLAQMLRTMPAPVKALATQLQNGSIGVASYTKGIKALPAAQYTLGAGFATLYEKANGFNSLLKAGGPSVQTYDDAMKKMMGGATGLNTALMLGGENMSSFTANVAAVGAAGKGAGKDVNGWAETQKTFNVQMAKLKEMVDVTAIRIGTALIPVVLKVTGFFEKNKDAALALAGVIGVVLAASVVKFAAGAVVGAVKSVSDLAKGLKAAAMAVKAFAASEQVAAAMSKVAAAAQWLWNLAMDANPIMLVVIAIAALVGGLVYAYYHCEAFRKIVQAAFRAVEAAALAVWHALEAVWHGIVEGLTWLWGQIVDVWNSISSAVMAAWNAIASFFVSAWHAVADPIVSAWHTITQITSTVWNALLGFFRKWWPLLLVIFMPFVAIAMAIWNHFHQQIIGTAKTVWNAVAGFFVGIWNAIVTAAKTAWTLFQNYIVAPLVAVGHFIESTWNTIYGWLVDLWHLVEAGAKTAWHAIQVAIINPIVATWNEIVSIWHTVSGWLSAAWHAIASVASSVWNAIKSAIINPLTGAWHSVVSIVGNIASAIGRGLQGAWNAVSGIASKFWSIGSNIVSGIISGIENAASSLFDTLKNLASNALKSAKSFLGINSPSKVFADHVGMAIPEGIAKGINDHAHLAHTAVTNLAGQLTSQTIGIGTAALSAGMPVGAAAAGASQPIVVQIDRKTLFTIMQTEALRYGRRNPSTGVVYQTV